MDILEKLEEMQISLEEIKNQRIRLEGQLEAIQSEMTELGFTTIKKLEARILKLERERRERDEELELKIEEFEGKYADLLKDLE